MGGIRNDDLPSCLIAPGIVILLDEQHAGEFAVRAGSRFEGHVVHARDLAQQSLRRFKDLAAAFGIPLVRKRMDMGKSFKRRRFLVDARIVFHGTGAERVEAAVDAVHLLRKLGVVARDFGLGKLGQCRPLRAF